MIRTESIDVEQFIEANGLSGFHGVIMALCFLVVLIEGVDIGLIAYIAPAVRHEWGFSLVELSPVFAAALIGTAIGSFVFGPLADRFGRRPIVIASVLFFGVAAIATLFCHNVHQLALARLIGGLGFGGAGPSVVALVAEFAPPKWRMQSVSVMFTGPALGSALGGLIASHLVPAYGWRSMLVLGGGVPLVLVPFLIACLPESMYFLAVKHRNGQARIRAIAKRISKIAIGDSLVFSARQEKNQKGISIRELFAPEFAFRTLLLWITAFAGNFGLYLLWNWLPIILTAAGGSIKAASVVTAMHSIGGVVGTLCLGYLAGRVRSQRFSLLLTGTYVVAGVMIIAVGQIYAIASLAACTTFLVGFFLTGSNSSVNGLGALLYPTAMRATGLGCVLALGRIGAIFSTLAGSFLLSTGWSYDLIFEAIALPAFVAAIGIGAMYAGTRLLPAVREGVPERVH
ncbi:MFS transporter [Paraburkholderia sp.]|uniref:MFS transporter n=1 Tax=Paraburkholderia sp. TaxID=1926495 RepID=UPI00238D553F|nr:MFS transporter [Paraburkholderia sp.]MDE1180045.1 MFS transporter [Paraburkholderia sp.]